MWAVDNPVIVRELRVRMRGNRALWMQAAYVGVLSAVLLIGYWQAIQQADAVADGRLGELMFGWLSTAQGVLLALMVPALAAGAISAEYEQQTLDALFSSAMSTSRLFWGKLVASSLFVGQLLTAGLPLMALCYLLGGVSLQQLLGVYAVQVSACLVLSAIGLGCSLHCRSTVLASSASYLCVIGYLIASAGMSSAEQRLGSLCPLAAYSADGDGLRHVATAVGVTLALAFVLLDFCICRARLLRDGMVSWRPRFWLAGLAAFALAWAFHDRAKSAPDTAVVVGVILALLLVSGPDGTEPRRHTRWWQFWRHAPESAPLFVGTFTGAALLAFVTYSDPAGYLARFMAVMAAVAMTRALHTATGRVWPARFMSVAAVSTLLLIVSASPWAGYALIGWNDTTANVPVLSLAQAALYSWVCLAMLYLMWRRRVFDPR